MAVSPQDITEASAAGSDLTKSGHLTTHGLPVAIPDAETVVCIIFAYGASIASPDSEEYHKHAFRACSHY